MRGGEKKKAEQKPNQPKQESLGCHVTQGNGSATNGAGSRVHQGEGDVTEVPRAWQRQFSVLIAEPAIIPHPLFKGILEFL